MAGKIKPYLKRWRQTGPIVFIENNTFIRVSTSTEPSPTPSISITPSISFSVTPSITPSLTSTPSISISETPSVSISATPSLSISNTPSITPSLTSTPSLSETPSISITPSITLSETPSLTPSISISETPSITPSITLTPSISITPSVSETPSISVTPTMTETPSISISNTPSITPSISISETPSITPSITITPSVSETPSISITPSVTETPSISTTPGLTISPSLSETPSISVSETPSITPSITLSNTPSISISNTPSITPSISISRTPSLSISSTPSISISRTPSLTPTLTPTPTPSPFVPVPSDPTLQIWYDGADSTQFQPTNPSNGSAITQWTDKSATAHNAAPTGGPGTRPLYTASIQNGKSGLYFDQVEDGLEAPMSSTLQNLTGSTMIWVGKTFNTGSTQQVLQGVVKSGGSYTAVNGYSLSISGSYGYIVSMASGSAVANTTLDTNFHIHTLVFDGTQIGNSNRLKYRVDGVQQSLTFLTNVSSSTSPSINSILFGTDANLNNDFLGYMGEVLLYTRALTTTELNNTENYLKTKWNPPPVPSPTPTISVTPSITPSITRTPSVTPTISITPTPSSSPLIISYSNFEQYIVGGVRQASTYDLTRTNISTSRRLIVTSPITVTGFKFIRIPPDNWSSITGYSVTGTLSIVAGTGATIDGGTTSKSFNTKSTVATPPDTASRANTTSQYDIYDVRPVDNTTTVLTAGEYTMTLFGTGANMDIATLTTTTFPINTSGPIYPSGSATHFAMQVF